MKKTPYIIMVCLSLLACDNESDIPQQQSPFISKVFAYCPAPGQFVNVLPAGQNQDEILKAVSEILVGGVSNGLVTLGAWGGYIVTGFDHPIKNIANDYDFKVYGNASTGCSEPGIVMVSSDVNGNGLPDDSWYELAGSEYSKDSTQHNYRCVYYRPKMLDGDVIWIDNKGSSGCIARNEYHTQESYFPLWLSADSLVFEGTCLASNAILSGTTYILNGYAWGYADNRSNASGEACFDIDWAVDDSGCHISLSSIDFVKIYTAQQQCLGRIGETSTEVAGIEDLHP